MFGASPSCCTIDIVMEGFLIALVLLPLSAAADNLYALTATDIAGNRVSLDEYKGKVTSYALTQYCPLGSRRWGVPCMTRDLTHAV